MRCKCNSRVVSKYDSLIDALYNDTRFDAFIAFTLQEFRPKYLGSHLRVGLRTDSAALRLSCIGRYISQVRD